MTLPLNKPAAHPTANLDYFQICSWLFEMQISQTDVCFFYINTDLVHAEVNACAA